MALCFSGMFSVVLFPREPVLQLFTPVAIFGDGLYSRERPSTFRGMAVEESEIALRQGLRLG